MLTSFAGKFNFGARIIAQFWCFRIITGRRRGFSPRRNTSSNFPCRFISAGRSREPSGT